MKKIEWREDETFTEYKMRKHEGMQGMGQKTVKKREGWSDNQKRGLTNKNKGRRKQNLARKKGEVRVEVKAGKQVQTLWTKYQKAKEQSDANTRIGDTRPFMFVAMPDGTSNGLVVVELDKLDEVVFALLETWEE